jgi:hypothetical protein
MPTPKRVPVQTPVTREQLKHIITAYAAPSDGGEEEPNRATVRALAVQLDDTLAVLEATTVPKIIVTPLPESERELVSGEVRVPHIPTGRRVCLKCGSSVADPESEITCGHQFGDYRTVVEPRRTTIVYEEPTPAEQVNIDA